MAIQIRISIAALNAELAKLEEWLRELDGHTVKFGTVCKIDVTVPIKWALVKVLTDSGVITLTPDLQLKIEAPGKHERLEFVLVDGAVGGKNGD